MVRRDPARPIITPEQIPPSRPDVEVIGAFNPGAVRVGSEIVLLIRVAERPLCPDPEWVAFPAVRPGARGVEVLRVRRDNPDLNLADPRFVFYRGQMYLTSISHLRVARSSDGVHFQVDPEPTLLPEGPYEWYGLEDPRITPLEGRYVIAYTSVSHLGVTVSLVETEDFRRFERLGVIFPPSNKDVALFPERVGGRYVALHRPSDLTLGQPEMWLAFSPDLRHWGRPARPLGWGAVGSERGTFPYPGRVAFHLPRERRHPLRAGRPAPRWGGTLRGPGPLGRAHPPARSSLRNRGLLPQHRLHVRNGA